MPPRIAWVQNKCSEVTCADRRGRRENLEITLAALDRGKYRLQDMLCLFFTSEVYKLFIVEKVADLCYNLSGHMQITPLMKEY